MRIWHLPEWGDLISVPPSLSTLEVRQMKL